MRLIGHWWGGVIRRVRVWEREKVTTANRVLFCSTTVGTSATITPSEHQVLQKLFRIDTQRYKNTIRFGQQPTHLDHLMNFIDSDYKKKTYTCNNRYSVIILI